MVRSFLIDLRLKYICPDRKNFLYLSCKWSLSFITNLSVRLYGNGAGGELY